MGEAAWQSRIHDLVALHSQSPKPEAILNKHVDNLKSQLDARDRAIQGLKDELEKALYERDKSMDEASERNDALSMLQSKLQALQKSDLAKVGQIADKDIIITKLRTELQFAQQDGNAIQNEKKVSELHKAIGQLKEEMAEKDADNTVFFKSSKILEKKSVMLTTELQKRGDELQRQQKEILSLQQKKDGLFAEFQTQEHRIFQLQESLQSRDVEAEHWKAQIAQLQSELEATRNLYKQATRQLEDLKLTAQQQGQSSKDNQNVLTAEAAHWHDAFVALKSDFIELEKKHLQALAQISFKEEATKKLNAEFMKTTAKLDDTKHELEGVQAELVEASCERDAVQTEMALCVRGLLASDGKTKPRRIPEVCPKIITVPFQFTHTFVKPSAMIYKAVTEVQYNRVYNQKDNKELIIGDSTQCFLDSAHQNGLQPDDVEEFFKNVKKFFTAACDYMLKKMPLNEPVLQHIEVADVSQRLNSNTSSLIMERFPSIMPPGDSSESILLEFCVYQYMDVEYHMKDRLDETWKSLSTAVDEEGKPLLKNLPLFMLNLMTIPHSSAHCQRVFSCVRKTKTKQRASMDGSTLQALPVVKSNSSQTASRDYSVGMLKRL
ncbi:UNVERIFIED_CONTAM: hypothetical protein FKN15_025761 [Acipenser sinensis]